MVIAELAVPVVAAPMAGGPSTAELVAAVGEAGGLGFLAGGYLTAESLARQIADVWDASSRPFGVNLFVPDHANTYLPDRPRGLSGHDRAQAVALYRDALAGEAAQRGVELAEPGVGMPDAWERQLDLVVRERVPVVSFTFGLPGAAVFSELSRAGIETVVTVTDHDEATAAISAGADALCLQGPDAGGHRGTLDPAKRPAVASLAELVAAVRPLTQLPLIAAGGIATAEGAAAMVAAGADAVQLGTAFLLTPEAGTSLAYRRALADPALTTTTVTRAFSGRWARALTTDFVLRYGPLAPAAYPEVHHVTVPLRRAAAATDEPELLALWAGTGWREATAVPAATVVAHIARSLTGR
ncbi:nitroalkane oxidase [Humibacillus sp. DSM 29435]|uniref:nitronate monooxygenase n=1 Tax=Humibacillus sp. DSM 29435 TaxID=1869167 RepID=UPI000872254B|nr:nitronate monooxygenase [Humibacillus sp. DSM 29435]OFE16912.1 nitroalkane oxidase [Humibacillus sp. DSM 29435]